MIRTWNKTAAGPTTHPGESMMIYLAIRARAGARSRAAATSSCTRWPDGAIDPTNRRNISCGSGDVPCVQRKADRCRWPDRGLPGIAVKEPGEGICRELLHQEAAERGLPLVRGIQDVDDAGPLGLELLCQVFSIPRGPEYPASRILKVTPQGMNEHADGRGQPGLTGGLHPPVHAYSSNICHLFHEIID